MSEPGAIKRMPRPGTIVPFGGDTIPSGWLLCNGAEVSRTDYRRLFDAIGTYWGAGDGETTFNVPDSRGKFLQGVSDADSLGVDVGEGVPYWYGYFLIRRIGSGSASMVAASGPLCFRESYDNNWGSPAYSSDSPISDKVYFDPSTYDSRYSSDKVQPPAVVMNYMIRC